MVRLDEVLAGINRGLKQSGRLPSSTTYEERTLDMDGTASPDTTPFITVSEVTTIEDNNRSTNLVGYVRNDEGQIIGRIFQTGFETEAQIDVGVAAGGGIDIGDLRNEVRLVLLQYDDQFRGDPFPSGDGDGIGDVRVFSLTQSQPADDLSVDPGLRRQRLSANIIFVDRVNEVDQWGPIEPIKQVRTPRDGDYAGGLSDEYSVEYHAPTNN